MRKAIGHNLIGTLAPLVVAAGSMAILARTIDPQTLAFGLLMWVIANAAAVIDLGIVRALVLERLRMQNMPAALAEFVQSASNAARAGFLLLAIGLGALYALNPRLFQADPASLDMALTFALTLACLLPTFLSHVPRAMLESHSRFGEVALWRAIGAMINFGVPGALAATQITLPMWVMFGMPLLLGRIVQKSGFHYAYSKIDQAQTGLAAPVGRFIIRPYIANYRWLMLSSLISPFMVYADRFLAGQVASPSASVAYLGAADMLARYLILPMAVSAAAYPLLCEYVRAGDDVSFRRLTLASMLRLTLISLLICSAAALLLPWVLTLWIGNAGVAEATPALRILLIGLAFNGMSFIPFAVVQAKGHSEVIGRLHMIQLPIYAAALYWLGGSFGLIGIALATAGRYVLDWMMLMITWRLKS